MKEINDYLNRYNQKISRITRFLWWSAGADEQILEQCPMYDRVKYAGIGGIVFATGFLASISGGYAFYVILSQKNGAIGDDSLDVFASILSTIFGLIWGAIVFNMDRFIISSTGKSESEDIEGKEMVQALPRLFIALVLGICIAAPLETRIMKTEITAKLQIEQEAYLNELNEASNKNFTQKRIDKEKERTEIQAKIDSYETYFEKRRLEIKEQRNRLELEADGKIAGHAAGRGPGWKDKKENLDKMEAEDAEKRISIQPEIDELKARKANLTKDLIKIEKEKDLELKKNDKEMKNYDGLIRRIRIGHEISPIISVMITLMLLSIELGPIFFKMMLSKGVYEYLSENKKRKFEALNGIVFDSSLIESNDGTLHANKVEFLEVDAMVQSKKQVLEEQEKRNQQVIKAWSKQKESDIDSNPSEHYS